MGSKHSSRDPRPVGDRAYAAQCAKNVVEFLQSHNFNRTLTYEKLLRDPSTKDFFDVFKFLIAHIDPALPVEGKMEDEVPALMRRLKYPVEVNRSKLQAISGPNTWPQLLAVLDWLVNLVQCVEETLQPFATCQVPLQDPGDADYDDHSHILQAAMQKNYQLYLNCQDDGEDEARLRQIYEERIAALTGEVDRSHEQWTIMEQRLHEYQTQHERLLELRTAPQHLEAEAERIKGIVKSQEDKAIGLEDETLRLASEFKEFQEEAEGLQATSRKLTEQIESQSYSKKDIERLKGERSHLRTVLANLRSDCERADQDVWELGIEESRLADVLHRAVRCANERLEASQQLQAGDMSMDDLMLRVDLEEPSDELAAMDFSEVRTKLREATQNCAEVVQREDAAQHEVLESQRTVQEELALKERECRRLKARLEQLHRMREEHREWSIKQLEEAQKTAEQTEDAVYTMAMDGGGSDKLRDAAEVDQLRLQLAALKTDYSNERAQAEEQLKRQQEKFASYKKNVQVQLETYVQQIEEIAAETLRAVQDETEDPDAASRPFIPSRAATRGGS
eukprot:CAMPEP_0178409378 /NCGR_PEP_ID=MMETSP0689_2-20121128/20431_1 /TAXON_ID=160604 /ORGANISM="Amphidinium massartii, Strain CS-259" /LENGTH=564 /DNA_ID=CAMNT_0020030517 /DNA_START=186 /DNA_END=1880 /DNA_ORIENTATION=+